MLSLVQPEISTFRLEARPEAHEKNLHVTLALQRELGCAVKSRDIQNSSMQTTTSSRAQ